MPQSLASRSDSLALAAAMSRHPAAGAQLVGPAGGGAPVAAGPPADEDSWVVVVVGDGRGGVSAIGRAPLSGQAVGTGLRSPVRLALGALRARLAGPARAGEGLAPPASESPAH